MKVCAPMFRLLAIISVLGSTAATGMEFHGISHVLDLNITMLSTLPPAPAAASDREFCGHLLTEPVSKGGKLAASQGWGVTGELELNGLTLVSFVGGFEAGTSGSCALLDGNVGFFDEDGNLVALAFANAPGETVIGRIEPFGDTGARIWDGDLLSVPKADVTISSAGEIALVELAAEEPFCGGEALVPDIYGMPIADARALLVAAGWEPVVSEAREGVGSYPAVLIEAGITEVTDCAGTGFGYCGFEYQSDAASLSVTTVGDPEPPETPGVSGYDVSCKGK